MLSKEKVEAVLFKMGMPANVKGFGYIVDSVLLLEEDSKIKTTYLYFKVAQQHGTTGQRVERAIRHAFDIVRSCRGDYDVVNHYIGFINCANSQYAPYQKNMNFFVKQQDYIKLNPETYFYVGMFNDTDEPYGVPPFMPCLLYTSIQSHSTHYIATIPYSSTTHFKGKLKKA